MSDPKAPEMFQRLLAFMREADEWAMPADVLRSAEDAGLHIVSEAERKVLEARKAELESPAPSTEQCLHCKRTPCAWFAVCAEAEWRRR